VTRQRSIDGTEPRRTRLRRRSAAALAQLPGQKIPAKLRDWLTSRARALRWSRAALVRHLLQSARDRATMTGVRVEDLEQVTIGGRVFLLVPVQSGAPFEQHLPNELVARLEAKR
jgi:hypothetical protein